MEQPALKDSRPSNAFLEEEHGDFLKKSDISATVIYIEGNTLVPFCQSLRLTSYTILSTLLKSSRFGYNFGKSPPPNEANVDELIK